jgi:hypothetical protein
LVTPLGQEERFQLVGLPHGLGIEESPLHTPFVTHPERGVKDKEKHCGLAKKATFIAI